MSSAPTVQTPWNDPAWVEPGDNAWRRGLRWQQAWWRSERLHLPPGPHSPASPGRLVSSSLPLDADPHANFLTDEAADAAEERLAGAGGGLVHEDRLRRNLLSSQPLCFNLFGHFRSDHRALEAWVRHVRGDGHVSVTRIELEWAPTHAPLGGGSAFDAFVEYRTDAGTMGFVGVECKYAEHLPATDVPTVRPAYRDYTDASARWRTGASDRLDRRGLRQLWLNTLLAHSLLDTGDYAEGHVVVAACAADEAARKAVEAVRAELEEAIDLAWCPYESILPLVDGHDAWRSEFVTRYLDFRPVTSLLRKDDPRRRSDDDGGQDR